MGAVAPLSVLLVGLVGLVVVAVAVVRIALLERASSLSSPLPHTPTSHDVVPAILPGAAAA